ncbi:MAG: hypothetical protein EBY32_11570 [Proteobacteria bacterium]|nr:hypothetical protein [Pseudomonadota bacterium]
MKPPLSRPATEIPIIETRSFIQDGVQQSSEVREIALEVVIDEFLLKLGQSSAHVLGVVIQVLTRGKVRVDFRDYHLRLEMRGGVNCMERSEAVAVFDDYIKRHKNPDSDRSADVTQKIMVQAPRVSLPKARPR